MIVGLISSYREGPLVQAAVASTLEACDEVLVMEGPAGDPLEADVPETDLGPHADDPRVTFREGRWRTDARKRQAMLEWTRKFDPPVWGMIVDADEALINGRFLPHWVRRLDWHEQVNEDAEYIGRPLRLIEADGAVSWVRGRLLRMDRLVEYKVSTSVFTVRTSEGIVPYKGGGNEPDKFSDWETPRTPYIEKDRMLVMPPLPMEPHLVHLSLLRHPLRSDLRMHQQEREQLILAGLPVD